GGPEDCRLPASLLPRPAAWSDRGEPRPGDWSSNSRRFALSSELRNDKPVRFPPGCARLLTAPAVIASARTNTIGIVEVASLTAKTGTAEAVTITSGFSATSSDASCETGPARPAAER